MDLRKTANWLTLSRLFMIPPFLLCLGNWGKWNWAPLAAKLIISWVAISDLVDGSLARASKEENPLGRFLDPLADKVCIGIGYLGFSLLLGRPPWLITGMVLGRFILLGGLWFFALRASGEPLPSFLRMRNILTTPNLLGKATTWAQLILLFMLLFSSPPTVLRIGYWGVGTLTPLSMVVYLWSAIRQITDQQGSSDQEARILGSLARVLAKFRIFS